MRSGDGADDTLGSAANFPLNQWTHVAFVYDGIAGRIALYANGVFVEDKTVPPGPVSLTPAHIGAWFVGGSLVREFDGRIDEFAIYNRVLDDLEIAARSQRSSLPGIDWTNDAPAVLNAPTTFVDEGTYLIEVLVGDGDGGTDTATTSFEVENSEPVILGVNAASSVAAIGDVVRFDAQNVFDAGILDTQSYLWEVATNNAQSVVSSDDLRFDFTPEFAGLYDVTLTVTDNDGGQSFFTHRVTVNPVAGITAPTVANQGTLLQFTPETSSAFAPAKPFAEVDPRVRREYSWTVTRAGSVVKTSDAETLNFVPESEGPHTVSLIVTDVLIDGTTESPLPSVAAAVTIDVAEFAPISIVRLLSDQAVESTVAAEGDVIRLGIAGLRAVGVNDARQIDWTVTTVPSGLPFEVVPVEDDETFAIRPIQDGQFQVSVTVDDDIFVNQSDPSVRITRTATAPSLLIEDSVATIVADQIGGLEGGIVTLNANVLDAGFNDSHDYVIDWGDGSQPTLGDVVDGEISATHVYLVDGLYHAVLRVTDTSNADSARELSINVTIENAAPVGVDDEGATDQSTSARFTLESLLSNDTDDGGDPLSIIEFDARSRLNASVVMGPSGELIYDPSVSPTLAALAQPTDPENPTISEALTDVFTYTLSDDSGALATATVTVTVSGLNDAPVASADQAMVNEDATEPTTGNLLSNDSDVDTGVLGSTLNVIGLAGETNAGNDVPGMFGTLDWEEDGSYAYSVDLENTAVQRLAAGKSLTDVFPYTVSDGIASTVASLTITINGSNDAPIAGDDQLRTIVNDRKSVPVDSLDDLIVEDAPIAYWRFAEASGTIAMNEFAPDTPDGFYVGSPELLTRGLVRTSANTAVRFDGTQWISIADDPRINLYSGDATERSFEVLFRADDVLARQTLYQQGNSGTGFGLFIDQGQLAFRRCR